MNRRLPTRRRRLALLVVGILCTATAIAGGTTGPVFADSSTSTTGAAGRGTDGTLGYQQGVIQSAGTGMCLDSNKAGDVYVLPCTANNPYQLWDIWNGGWTQNVATGRCLTNTHPARYTYRLEAWGCVESIIQYWTHWHGGWYQSHQRDEADRLLCAASYGQGGWPNLELANCYDLREQFWWVW